MTHRAQFGLLLLLALLPVLAWADAYKLTVIEVRYQPAQELISQLRPLLIEGAGISANSHQLLVRTSESNLAQIRHALANLDHPPRPLRLSLREYVVSSNQDQSRVHRTSENITPPRDVPMPHQGARTLRTEPRSQTVVEQTIDIMEGRWSNLSITSQHPELLEMATWLGHSEGNLITISPSQSIRRIAIRARVQQESVIVDLRTEVNGATDMPSLPTGRASYSTRISGPLGEWLTVGETSGSTAQPIPAYSGTIAVDGRRLVTQVKVQPPDALAR